MALALRTRRPVVAAGDEAKTHLARFGQPPDPSLARPDIAVTLSRDNAAIKCKVRRGMAAPARPWLLTAPHPTKSAERLTYVGELEESQCDKYVLIIPDETGGFKMVACHDWYAFVPRPQSVAAKKAGDSAMAQELAEKKMGAMHAAGDHFLQRKAVREGEGEEAEGKALDVTADDVEIEEAQERADDQANNVQGEAGDGVGKDDAEDDVYNDAGEEDVQWMNAVPGGGDEDGKHEDLDLDQLVSDDEDDAGSEPSEPKDALDYQADMDDLRNTVGKDPASDYQRVDQAEESEGEGEGEDEDLDDDLGSNLATDAALGAGQSGAGKRDRPEPPVASGADSAGALGKRPRVGDGGANNFMREADLVDILRSYAAPPTARDFMVRIQRDFPVEARTQKFLDWVTQTLNRIVLQVEHNGHLVLVLQEAYVLGR